MSAEDYEGFRMLKEHRQACGVENRAIARDDFEAAQRRAFALVLVLNRHSEAHYSLQHPTGWVLHIYPGNQRLYSDPKRTPRPPFVKLPQPWTLDDVLDAIAEAIR